MNFAAASEQGSIASCSASEALSDSSNGIGQPIYDVHLLLLRGAIFAGVLHRKTPPSARPAHKKDRRVEPAPHRF